MIKTKVAFLKGRLLSIQPEQFKKYSKSSKMAGKKPALQKKHFCFDHVNMLNVRSRCPVTFVLVKKFEFLVD